MGRATVALPALDGAADPPSGSLTGEVLSHGDPDQPGRSRTIVVLLTILGALLMLAVFGATVTVLAGDALSSFFDSLLG